MTVGLRPVALSDAEALHRIFTELGAAIENSSSPSVNTAGVGASLSRRRRS